MKTILLAILSISLSGCANLTPEQNDRLINAGIGLGTTIVTTVTTKVVKADTASGK